MVEQITQFNPQRFAYANYKKKIHLNLKNTMLSMYDKTKMFDVSSFACLPSGSIRV